MIIDNFDIEIIKVILKNDENYELHDEIIAMTCKRYNTDKIYSTDKRFEEKFKLKLRSWY